MHLGKLVTALHHPQPHHYGSVNFTQLSVWTDPAASAKLAPSQDSFYTSLDSSEIAQYSPGHILKSRPVSGFSDNTNVNAFQVVYRSENSNGSPVCAITTIIVPQKNDDRNVVVYPQAEDSACIDCATSHKLIANGLGSRINSLLRAGYTLIIPDHEGFNSSFGAGVLEGKLTLDSIRAFENSRDLVKAENSQFVVIGYSGGSIPAGWAAELYGSYAPELNIKGFAMGGYVTSLAAVMKKVNRSLEVGFVPSAFTGLASEYLQLWDTIYNQVSTSKLKSLLKVRKQCSSDNIMQFAYQDFFNNFKSGPEVLSEPAVQAILDQNALGKITPSVPMFIYNGVQDQIVPIQSVDEVVKTYCRNGASLTYRRGANTDHFSMEPDTFDELTQWVSKIFGGYTAAGCAYEGAAMHR